jgi:KipI family sensor histidine kinase inhibitor
VTEVVPAYASFAVFYDPLIAAYLRLVDSLRGVIPTSDFISADSAGGRVVRIPVRYDGEDLAEVARVTSHTVDEVIELHSSRTYYAYVIGFVPGFAYLGEIDSSLVMPRRAAPRKRVPQGSVAIAETQTGVYPFATPGGWHLLGTTDVRMFDPDRAEPALIHVGDSVIFEPVR